MKAIELGIEAGGVIALCGAAILAVTWDIANLRGRRWAKVAGWSLLVIGGGILFYHARS